MTRSCRHFPKIVTEDELSKIIDAINKSASYWQNKMGDYNRERDKAIILLMYYCGLRPLETLVLSWRDVDYEKDLIYVRPYYNKERNDTPAILTAPGKRILLKYQEVLKQLDINSEFVFPSMLTGVPLTSDSFAKRFQKIVKEAGISKIDFYTAYGRPVYSVHPYTLRHSFCTKIYKKTHSEEAVTQLARHVRPESAHVYIHLDTDDKKKIADEVFK